MLRKPKQQGRSSRLAIGTLYQAIDSILRTRRRDIAVLQFGCYLIVGGICFSIDITGFVVLRYLNLPILTASAISFTVATISNYLLCCAFVFRSGRFSRREELLRLFGIAIVGLTLNSAAVWLFAGLLAFNPTFAKILAVLPVLAWNYHGRRLFVFDGSPAVSMVALAERSRGRQ
jgi:putative flippase GtrA